MQDRNLWFSAELNHRPVNGWLLPLFDVEEVLWAPEVDGIGILIWHGALKSFMLVEYGIARWIRLSRNQSDEVLWLFLMDDVKGCLVEKFGLEVLGEKRKDCWMWRPRNILDSIPPSARWKENLERSQ